MLSGCGVFDGAEIHESVLALLALDRAGAEVLCMAPDVELDVIDHRTQRPSGERRSVLVESARIARGDIRDVADVTADEVDALVFPGGYGAAKNLCDFAVAGDRARVEPSVAKLIAGVRRAGKPICAICIAPAMLAAALRDEGTSGSLTVGNDAATARAIESMGSRHVACPVEAFHVDQENRVVTTPAYMLAGSIKEAAEGIEKAIAATLRMAG